MQVNPAAQIPFPPELKKDPGIPNLYPFKEQLLQQIEDRRQQVSWLCGTHLFVACSCWFLYVCLLWVRCSALSGHFSITNRNILNGHILYSLCMHHWVVSERERRGTPLISRFVYKLLSFVTSVDFFVWVQYCCVGPSLLQHLSPPSYNTCPLPLTTLVPSLLQHLSPPSYSTLTIYFIFKTIL